MTKKAGCTCDVLYKTLLPWVENPIKNKGRKEEEKRQMWRHFRTDAYVKQASRFATSAISRKQEPLWVGYCLQLHTRCTSLFGRICSTLPVEGNVVREQTHAHVQINSAKNK